MHILWLKTELLHPVDKGGRIRTYNMLRELRREHHVTYLALDDGMAAPDATTRAAEYCHELITVPFAPPRKGATGYYAALAENVISRLPYAVARYRSRAMRRAIERALATSRVDVIVCDFLAPSLNVPDGLSTPVVLFQHNVEAMIWRRHSETATNPVMQAYMREQWRRMRRFEAAECRRFDHVIAVSAQDASVFRDDYGVRSISDVSTGVDTTYFRPSGAQPRQRWNLVFTGSMDWLPNEDAILWFTAEVLPSIRSKLPDVTLTVVGRDPTSRIRDLDGRDGVEVTGSVPDVRPFIERANVFIVPIRIGGGTRLKIYEAMAMERAVVSTTIGAEGLPVRNGVDALLADDASAFADAVVKLLTAPEGAETIGCAGAELVRARFAWPAVTTGFAETCESVIARRQRVS